MSTTPRPTIADRPEKKSDPAWILYANAVVGDIFEVYPERTDPHPFVPTRTAVMDLLKNGEEAETLIRAARNYRSYCAREGTLKMYVIGPVRFYRDAVWTQHKEVRVEGRTREQWARSGQDVAEFDRIVGASV
jgi:hypothetical protein